MTDEISPPKPALSEDDPDWRYVPTPEERARWTKSAVLKQARRYLGPMVAMWEEDTKTILGFRKGAKRVQFVSGADPWECFHRAFILPLKAKEVTEHERERLLAERLASGQEPMHSVEENATVDPLRVDPES